MMTSGAKYLCSEVLQRTPVLRILADNKREVFGFAGKGEGLDRDWAGPGMQDSSRWEGFALRHYQQSHLFLMSCSWGGGAGQHYWGALVHNYCWVAQ
jgi:hypothetical protein